MSTPTPRRGTGLVGLVGLISLAGLLLAGCGARTGDDPAATAAQASPTTTQPSTGAASGADSTAGGDGDAAETSRGTDTRAVPGPGTPVARTAPRALQPVRISIPAIGVDATMTDLGIGRGGAIEVPGDPDQAGWLDTTPAPGQQGPAVVAGHVDSTTGPAVFYRLRDLDVGDAITLTRRNGSRVTFTVDGVRTYAKRAFPTSQVYGPAPGPVLRLITCGGDYVKTRGGYLDNVVVFAS